MALANGIYAECTVAKAAARSPIPAALSTEQAALRLVITTGAQLIEEAVKPSRGRTVLKPEDWAVQAVPLCMWRTNTERVLVRRTGAG